MSLLNPPLPKTLPLDIQKVVKGLSHTKNKQECLRKAYAFVAHRYYGVLLHPFNIWTVFSKHFPWDRKRQHCNALNYFLRTLLIKSGWFSPKDIKKKWAFVWYFSPHQYLQINGTNVDPWAATRKAKIGTYAHGFRFKL